MSSATHRSIARRSWLRVLRGNWTDGDDIKRPRDVLRRAR